MRKQHIYDSSFVFQWVLNEFYLNRVVVVSDIVNRFEYDKTTVYKMLNKIDNNLVLIESKFHIVKVKPGCYKMQEVECYTNI